MTTCAATPCFSAVPLRAACDERLTALDYKVLMAVASHDRFNANGQACWASNERLAANCKVHPNSVSRAIRRLLKFDYLRDLGTRPGKRRGRTRFLTVIYNEEDHAAFDAQPEPMQAPKEAEQPAEKAELQEPASAAQTAQLNPPGLVELNPVGLHKREGRNSAEAEGSARRMQLQRRAPPPRPQPRLPMGRDVLARKPVTERIAAERSLALTLGKGDLSKGYELLKRIPDQRRTRHDYTQPHLEINPEALAPEAPSTTAADANEAGAALAGAARGGTGPSRRGHGPTTEGG